MRESESEGMGQQQQVIDRSATVDVLKVARFMFDRNADAMGANEEARDYYWGEPEVNTFWTGEAEAILSFLGFAGPA